MLQQANVRFPIVQFPSSISIQAKSKTVPATKWLCKRGRGCAEVCIHHANIQTLRKNTLCTERVNTYALIKALRCLCGRRCNLYLAASHDMLWRQQIACNCKSKTSAISDTIFGALKMRWCKIVQAFNDDTTKTTFDHLPTSARLPFIIILISQVSNMDTYAYCSHPEWCIDGAGLAPIRSTGLGKGSI